MKAVLDTNVLISAFFWNGNERAVLKKCKDKELEMLISPEMLEEVETVLKFKFSVPDDRRADFLRSIIVISELVFPSEEIDEIKSDPADNRILECAASGKADYIVSGDRHLLGLGKYRKIEILNAREMLKILRTK
jgi:putative PIN family toxin of toxin-antitoxin system